MRYVVYNIETTRYLRNHPKVKTDLSVFATASAALSVLTREVNRGAVKREDFAVAEASMFHAKIEKRETKINLMTNVVFEQPVNTPIHCDPSSETYWST